MHVRVICNTSGNMSNDNKYCELQQANLVLLEESQAVREGESLQQWQ